MFNEVMKDMLRQRESERERHNKASKGSLLPNEKQNGTIEIWTLHYLLYRDVHQIRQ